jgi:hypothetical protein
MSFDTAMIPPALVKAIQDGGGVLFVGAGFSIGAGLPDWKTLLKQMTDWCMQRGVNLRGQVQGIRRLVRQGRLMEAAQTLRERMEEQQFYEFLTETFRRSNLVVHPLNRLYNRGHLAKEVPHGVTRSSHDG